MYFAKDFFVSKRACSVDSDTKLFRALLFAAFLSFSSKGPEAEAKVGGLPIARSKAICLSLNNRTSLM